MNLGYITLARLEFQDWLWESERKRTRFEAWLDLVQKASFQDRKRLVNDKVFHEKKGQLVASLRYLSEAWHWAPGTVKKWLKLLQENGKIDMSLEQGITFITICNYEQYNAGGRTDWTAGEQTLNTGQTASEQSVNAVQTEGEQMLNEIKNDKNVKNVNNVKNIREAPEKEKIKKSSLKILDEENTRKKLREEFPQIDVDEEIAKMKDWLLANGKTKKDYPAYARNWLRRRRETSHDQPGRSNRPARFKTEKDDNTEKIGNTPIETIRKAKAILDATPEGSSTIMSGIPQGWKSDGW